MKFKKNRDMARKVIHAYKAHSRFDKLGMYTGSPTVPEDGMPVQDADDL